MKKTFAILLGCTGFLLTFPSGCGGGSGGKGGPVALEQVCQSFQDATCDYLNKCDVEWFYRLSIHYSCDQLIDCSEGIDDMVRAVQAGRLAYDADMAGRCLESFRSAPCAQLSVFDNMPAECEQVFTGLVQQDGECYQDEECASGLYCNDDSQNCPGQCSSYLDVGDSCDSGGFCDPEAAACDGNQQKCVPLAGEGESCADIDCQQGLVCIDPGGSATCKSPAAAGESCQDNRDCQADLICSQDKCTVPAAAGQACNVGSEASLLLACQAGLYCDADILHHENSGTCRPRKGSGEECIMFYECNSGLLCVGVKVDPGTQEITPGTCRKPLSEGETCNAALGLPECDWELYCDENSSTCRPLPGQGDACVHGENPECHGRDLYCDSLQDGVAGSCRQKKADGQPCSKHEECLGGYCNGGTCQSGSCPVP